MNADNAEYRQFLGKARDARRGGQEPWAVMSTGKKVAVALALNRAEWLGGMAAQNLYWRD